MKTVLCYGDSNTHGTAPMPALETRRRFAPDYRWPCVMAQQLDGLARVIAEGLPGRTTVHDDPIEGPHKNGHAVLPAILESHRPLDLVIVMLGTNDLKARFTVTAFEIAQSVEKLGLAIRASGCGPDDTAPDVLVVSPPPILETGVLAPIFAGGETKSTLLATEIGKIADRNEFGFLDAGAIIDSSHVDGIHFEEDNQIALGRAIGAAVRHRL